MNKLYFLLGKLVVKAHYAGKLDIYALCSIHQPDLYRKGRRKAKIPTSIRWKVWQRDNYLCHYCGGVGPLSLDHIIPEKYGGEPVVENLVTACFNCNQRKSSTNYEEFLQSKWLVKKKKSLRT